MMASPVKQFKSGSIQVSIWENMSKAGHEFESISLDKRYKDSNGEWKSSHSFKVSDLPKAIICLQKAFEFLSLREDEMVLEKAVY